MLKFAAICPHPPIIIPTIGSPIDLEKASQTIKGMEKLSEELSKVKPETLLVISPHGPLDFDYFTINNFPILAGHFYNFGDFQTELIFKNDLDLVKKIEKECKKEKMPLKILSLKEIDHGSLVPLFYLSQKYPNFKIVLLTFSYLDREVHFEFGKLLFKVIKKSKENIGIIASGDLSHRITPDAPAGFSPKGKEFDEKLIKLLKEKKIQEILNLDPNFIEEAGECGYRSIVILLGALNKLNWKTEIISYQSPFGVGYLVANLKI